MRRALTLAQRAADAGDVPVGALVVDASGEVVGEGWNLREVDQDPTAHAEVVALRAAAQRLGSWRLEGCTLVVTMEPCPMCAGAAMLARVERVVFGAWDPKARGLRLGLGRRARPRATHRAEVVGGVLEEECGGPAGRFLRGPEARRLRPAVLAERPRVVSLPVAAS